MPTDANVQRLLSMRARGAARRSRSLDLVRACGLHPADPIIDVSGARHTIVVPLLEAGYTDITVLDPSGFALADLAERLGNPGKHVTLLEQLVTGFHPRRRYALWCDEGFFHALQHPEERQQYLETLEEALRPGGHLVIATFGPEGPEECEGVPVRCYGPAALQHELGAHFELAEHSVAVRHAPSGEAYPYLHARFVRHAPAPLGPY